MKEVDMWRHKLPSTQKHELKDAEEAFVFSQTLGSCGSGHDPKRAVRAKFGATSASLPSHRLTCWGLYETVIHLSQEQVA